MAAALAATAPPFAAYANLILFHFYDRGAFMLDSGLFAGLLSRPDPWLTQPDISIGGGSYLAVHAALVFIPFGLIGQMMPPPAAFALFFGLCHALLALAGFFLALPSGRHPLGPWIAALAGLGLACNGLTVAMALYPHPEVLIPALFLLFAAAFARGYRRLAMALFAAMLLVREDAGLHACAVLSLMIGCDRLRGVSLRRQRDRIAFAAVGVLYAASALLAQHLAFPEHVPAFTQNYIGDPPLAHLTGAALRQRLLNLLVNRPYVVLPGLATLIWAWLGRQPFLAIGYLACLPWLTLQLAAASPFASSLASYYAFPCVIGLAWPLVAWRVERHSLATRCAAAVAAPPSWSAQWSAQWPAEWSVQWSTWAPAQAEAVCPAARGSGPDKPMHRWPGVAPEGLRTGVLFAVPLALTWIPAANRHNPGHLPVPAAFLHLPDFAQQTRMDHAIAGIAAARPLLGKLRADNSVAAIVPGLFRRGEVELTPGMGNEAMAARPDTLVYMTGGYDADDLLALAAAIGLTRRHAVPGTPIHLITRRDLTAIPFLQAE